MEFQTLARTRAGRSPGPHLQPHVEASQWEGAREVDELPASRHGLGVRAQHLAASAGAAAGALSSAPATQGKYKNGIEISI